MPDIALLVGGKRYEGMESVRVTRSIESMAGSFALGVTDRWGALDEPWEILEEDACRVELDGQVVIDGYIDARDHSADDKSRALSYTGKDRAGALVENSLVLKQWTFRNLTFAEFATTIAKPWSVKVSVQAGLTLKKRSKIVVAPGDKAYEVLAREAAEDGVMLVSDGAGGIVLTRSGLSRATTSLVEGENIKAAKVSYDGTERFHRYVVLTQVSVRDDQWNSSTSTRTQAEYFDDGVRRTDRVLLIRPDKGYSVADAKRRAEWEARIRAAKAEQVMITVQGWTQPDGSLWPLNAIVPVEARRMIGVDGDLLISQIEHSISNAGVVTQLSLVRPDAFTPEPTNKNRLKAASYPWGKDFATKGAL